MQRKHIRTIVSPSLKETMKYDKCFECQTPCQSACKTSCTVSNYNCPIEARAQ